MALIVACRREPTFVKPMNRRLEGYRTEFLSVRPALKRTGLDALIFMASPVRGFTPLRAARFVTVKVPKPANCTRWFFFSEVVMVPRIAIIVSRAATAVQPVPDWITSIRC